MTELLRLENLTKTFLKSGEKITVLRGVDLSIGLNESISIIGKSGSGKSTFLQILGLLDRPTDGKIFMENQEVFSLPSSRIDRLRNKSIGFIFQFHHLLPDHSALQNVMMPLIIGGESAGHAQSEASMLLEKVGLGNRIYHKPGELSGGEQQRVAIARALVAKPKLILADEPTGNLDPATSDLIMGLLLSLSLDLGGTLVMVTHNTVLAQKCQRMLRLENGTFKEESC
ncbi:MAG: ABC transporter ATP-binding protein [Myxococcota bacterium]|nr:ABC transporter ATP-binding protein [Myxococcota bacterium]